MVFVSTVSKIGKYCSFEPIQSCRIVYFISTEVVSRELKGCFLLPFVTVPGMLEHESLQGISSMKPSGFRKRSNSIYEDSDTYTISSIIQQLSLFHSTMSQHGMDQGLINQAVKQLFYLVGAITLNNIMLRKDMCSCRKGMQIRSGPRLIQAKLAFELGR